MRADLIGAPPSLRPSIVLFLSLPGIGASEHSAPASAAFSQLPGQLLTLRPITAPLLRQAICPMDMHVNTATKWTAMQTISSAASAGPINLVYATVARVRGKALTREAARAKGKAKAASQSPMHKSRDAKRYCCCLDHETTRP